MRGREDIALSQMSFSSSLVTIVYGTNQFNCGVGVEKLVRSMLLNELCFKQSTNPRTRAPSHSKPCHP
jgi:hypothetical protein